MSDTPESGGATRRASTVLTWSLEAVAELDPKTCPPSRATREGWDAFEDGWSRFSNPYPADSKEADDWGWAWAEAQGHAEADAAIRAGADPEDFQ